VGNKTSDLVSSAIVSNLKPFTIRVKTLTYDNGKEFAGHSLIDQELNSTAYFARPFASWERGSNENLNGLLRQYIPKKRAMSTVSDGEIRMIQNRLNNRPRKRLGFKTPAEVFNQARCASNLNSPFIMKLVFWKIPCMHTFSANLTFTYSRCTSCLNPPTKRFRLVKLKKN
jgi:hypothetical protein